MDKSNLVQVSPKERIRRNPGESDADVRRRWAAQEAKYADRRQRGGRTLQRQENTDRAVMLPTAANKKWGDRTYAKGGSVSARADGIARKGKTKGRFV